MMKEVAVALFYEVPKTLLWRLPYGWLAAKGLLVGAGIPAIFGTCSESDEPITQLSE